MSGDLRDHAAIVEMCSTVTSIYPSGIDILINNAGKHATRHSAVQ